MKPRCIPLCLLLLILGSLLRGSELSGDLGYLRIHSIVLEREQLVAALAEPRALVLDLRYPLDERDAAETLRAALTHAPARPKLFVLVSPATPVPVVGVVAASPLKLLTLGVKGSRPEPQVVVAQSAADDRRAFDAMAGGTPLADLISGRIEKDRFDEASLVHEFKLGNPDAHPPETGPAKTADTPAKLIDRVLQRAIHLHRALQALKR